MAKKPKSVEKRNEPKRAIPAWIWMIMGSLMTLLIGVALYLWNPFKSPAKVASPQDGMPVGINGGVSDGATSNPQNKNEAGTNSTTKSKKDYEFYDILPEQEPTPIPDEVVVLEPDNAKSKNKKPDVVLKDKKTNGDTANNTETDDLGNTETYDGGDVVSEEDYQAQQNDLEGSGSGSESARKPREGSIAVIQDAKPDTPASKTAKEKPSTNVTGGNDPLEEVIAKETSKTTFILQINSFGSAEEADKRRAEVLLAGVDAKVVKTKLPEGGNLYQVISKVYKSRDNVFLAQKRLQSSGVDSIVVERKK